jgi:hypothetical protein
MVRSCYPAVTPALELVGVALRCHDEGGCLVAESVTPKRLCAREIQVTYM